MPERRFLVTIPARPADGDARELLELILAAASLELPLLVVFSGGGTRLLTGASAPAWRQLAEQGLVELAVLEDNGRVAGLPDWVRRLDVAGFEAARLARVEIQA